MNLTKKRYDYFATVASEIDKRIDRASRLFNSLLADAGVPHDEHTMLQTGTLYNCLDDLDVGIDIKWDSNWRFGGHDSGISSYTILDILDDTWEESITTRAAKVIERCQAEIKKEKRKKQRIERAEYERMKKRFGD